MPKARKTCNVFLSGIILAFSLGLFWISFLAIRRAGKPIEWTGSIAMTEAGHWFALFPLALLVISFSLPSNDLLDLIGRITLVAATACMSSSVFRAFRIRGKLQDKLEKSFGQSHATSAVLRWSRLYSLPWEKSVASARHRFSERGKKGLFLDFYPAVRQGEDGRSACLIVIHGGGWNTGNTRQIHWLNSRIAKQGTHVAAIQYQHTPKAIWPAQMEDVEEAVRWLKSNADQLKIDPDKIILYGRSAGGQIALCHACTPGMSSVAGCISVYAPCDMEWGWENSSPKDILNSQKLLANLFGVQPGPAPELLPTASPCTLAKGTDNIPPILLLHGTRDELVSIHHAREMTRVLNERGARSCFLELPWATHAFEFSLNGPSGQITTASIQCMLDFLKSDHSP